jgi:Neprosin
VGLAYRVELKYGVQHKSDFSGRGTGITKEAQVRGFRLGLLIAVAVSVLVPAVGKAAYTSPSLYDCEPRDPKIAAPPPQPDLPPEVAALLPKAIASNEFKAVCPKGEVPEPTPVGRIPKRIAPSLSAADQEAGASRVRTGRRFAPVGDGRRRKASEATASRSALSGYWYSWSEGQQTYLSGKGVNSLFAVQTNEQPYIPTAESEQASHSSAQIWAIKRGIKGCFSTAETGWSESIGQFGDVSPHLFVYSVDCGVGIGYAKNGGKNWVQSSGVTFPNQALTHNDVFHVYGARMDGNNWWIYYDGQWVGYIPHSAWINYFPNVITEAQAGGEVATVNYSTCADMGYNALFGGNPEAAMFSNVWYEYNYNTQSANTDLYSYSSDPSYYATGNWAYPPNHGYAFRYGGPGWC